MRSVKTATTIHPSLAEKAWYGTKPCAEDPCPAYGPMEPEALYVMQAAAGFAKANQLEPGMNMVFRLVQRK